MEKIAVVGIGCRFPGADGPVRYWELLEGGGDAIREVPEDRWDVDRYFDSHPKTPGKMNTRWGGFIDSVDRFDPGFFGITPREAERMDPQQRLVMEVAWETLEDAGITPQSLDGSKTGVFLGIGNYDYGRLLIKDPTKINAYDGTGNTLCIAANRLSYLLNLKGPSLVLESACSSSLVSLHYACRSLQLGESDFAIVGGASLILSPEPTISYSHAQMMSPNGRCKTFDAGADGYVRGEGCGIVILQRLSDALESNHRIQAVIAGSAVNQDGRSNGLTAPNGLAQQAVIQEALDNSGLDAADISYVEAHGTGTSLGDPIEYEALDEVYGAASGRSEPLFLGSVKTNIGHLEAAAGMAGLIKLVLMLTHRKIPAHLHLSELNPYIQEGPQPFLIPTHLQDWSCVAGIRRAGISSFGFGGTNSHVIVEEAPQSASETSPALSPNPHLFTLSAKSEAALHDLCKSYATHLTQHDDLSIRDLTFTASTGRAHFPCRLACVSTSIEQLKEQLNDFLVGGRPSSHFSHIAKRATRKPIVFLFTGQGSQYPGMGLDLYRTQPVFKKTVDLCDQILRPYLECSLLSVLFPEDGDDSLIHQTAYTQPALFAFEYALARLWMSWGIQPSLLIGHSLGEYVAAVLADVLSLEDGLHLVARRGQLIGQLPPVGAMAAVWSSPDRLSALVAEHSDAVSIATMNGIESCVLSGRRDVLEQLLLRLDAEGIRSRSLTVSHAFHSPLMEDVLPEFRALAESLEYHPPRIPILSNLTGDLWSDSMATGDYWCQHLREPVNFLAALDYLVDHQYELLLEVGTRPTLLGLAAAHFTQRGQQMVALPSLDPKKPDEEQITLSLAALYARGASVDWSAFHAFRPGRPVSLPTYRFQRERFWNDLATSATLQSQHGDLKEESPILKLIRAKDERALSRHMVESGNFSAEQLRVLPMLIKELVREPVSHGPARDVSEWIHSLTWIPETSSVPPATSSCLDPASADWLILADDGGVGSALAARLRGLGAKSIQLVHQQDEQRGVNHDLLIAELASSDPERPLRILHLWALDCSSTAELTTGAIEDDQRRAVGSSLELVQALLQHDGRSDCRCWFITQQALVAGQQSATEVSQAPLTAFVKVLALEHPDLIGGHLDLPTSVDEAVLAQVIGLVSAQARETQYALRAGQVLVPRLLQGPTSTLPTATVSSDHSYLITGGMGSLGLHVARWLSERGAGTLILMGRRGPDQNQQRLIEQIRASGTLVVVTEADVADQAVVANLFAEIQRVHPPLKGVFHCAGFSSVCEAADLSWQDVTSVFRPKTIGSWNLHRCTESLELDFFVCFSSISAVWGSRGQAHYAAANAFLDALAEHRLQHGLPALSIHWGPWDGGGMALDAFQQVLSRMGVTPLPVDGALMTLDQLLGAAGSAFTVADIEWSRFREIYELRTDGSLFDQLTAHQAFQDSDSAHELEVASELLDRLRSLSASTRLPVLIDHLRVEVARVLGYETSDLLEIDQGLFDLGVDSLMAMDIVGWIRTTISPSFSFLDLVSGATLDGVGRILAYQLFGDPATEEVQQLRVDLRLEATLDPLIVPQGFGSSGFAGPSPNILLTGVSGFLGAYLLHDILEATESTVYCFVRPTESQSGQQRIIQNLSRYGLWHEDYAQRVIPVMGDMREHHLGLPDDQYEHLSKNIDVIYQSAAVLNFVYPYSSLKGTNVFGTQEIIRLACHNRVKHLHYVSTDAVFDSSDYYDSEVEEWVLPESIAGIDLGYTQTKWVSERLVRSAGERGLPVTIYRPPLITGHSGSGAWNTEDFTCLFLKGCIELGAIPAIDARVTFVPVDYVSSAITALSRQQDSSGRCYHLSNPHSTSWLEVSEWIQQLGYSLAVVPYEEWESRLHLQAEIGRNVLGPLLPFFLKRWSEDQLSFAQLAQRRVRLNCDGTIHTLSGLGVDCPSVDFELIKTYLSYFKTQGFLGDAVDYSLNGVLRG